VTLSRRSPSTTSRSCGCIARRRRAAVEVLDVFGFDIEGGEAFDVFDGVGFDIEGGEAFDVFDGVGFDIEGGEAFGVFDVFDGVAVEAGGGGGGGGAVGGGGGARRPTSSPSTHAKASCLTVGGWLIA